MGDYLGNLLENNHHICNSPWGRFYHRKKKHISALAIVKKSRLLIKEQITHHAGLMDCHHHPVR